MTEVSAPARRTSTPLPGRLRLESILWLFAARALLWLRPFRQVRQLFHGLSARLPYTGVVAGVSPLVVGRAVRAASQVVPHATCLPQALAAEIILQRLRRPASLFLAGSLEGKFGFYAHAWVESDGCVVVGEGPGPHAVLGVLESPRLDDPAGSPSAGDPPRSV